MGIDNLIITIVTWLFWLMNLYSFVLVAYALMSWVPQFRSNAVGRLITKLAYPYLSLFERLPLRFAGLDFSVLVALISLQVIQKFIEIVINALL